MKDRFLIVDDMHAMRSLIAKYLKDLGYEDITMATNGMEALKIINSRPIDVVITDWNMPVLDGLELLKTVRRKPDHDKVAFVMITAEVARSQVHEAISAGVTDFLVKPFKEDHFRQKIRNVLERQRSGKLPRYQKDAILAEEPELTGVDAGALLKAREDAERIMLHDLKNPILSIQQSIAELASLCDTNPEALHLIHRITHAAHNLQGMTRLSADIHKIEQDTYTLPDTPLDLSELIQQLLHEKQDQCDELRIRLVLNDQPLTDSPNVPTLQVTGDSVLCYSMLANLVKNAIEASPMRSTIQVQALPHDGSARIVISNKGVVPAEIRAGFFDKYTTAGKRSGSGLGTYSAYMIAKAHGGMLAMDTDDVAKTTTLTLTLPLRAA